MRERQRRRRNSSICSCRSPRSTSLIPHSDFVWYEEVAKYLDGRSVVMLGATSTWFRRLIMTEESVWKYVSLRDLQVPVSDSCRVISKWKDLYASAFDGSHSYKFHQQEKHIDWMRIGAFSLDSPVVLVTEKLSRPEKLPKEENIGDILKSSGHCVLDNVKTGIWIAGTFKFHVDSANNGKTCFETYYYSTDPRLHKSTIWIYRDVHLRIATTIYIVHDLHISFLFVCFFKAGLQIIRISQQLL